VREMRRAGMGVGAHTYSHPNLAQLDPHAAELEVRRSKEILEDRLGAPVRLMAYPFGTPNRHFTNETVGVVSDAGYGYAAAVTWRGVRATDSPFRVPRFTCDGDSLNTLRDKVSGAWDLLGVCQERAPLRMRPSTKGPPSWWTDSLRELRTVNAAIRGDAVRGLHQDAKRPDAGGEEPWESNG
jgi:Polysaccharide deacetylase